MNRTSKAAITGFLTVLSLAAQQTGTTSQLAEKPHNMTRAVACVISTKEIMYLLDQTELLRPVPSVDERYATVSLSVWKRMIEDAIKNHLLIGGMTKSEAADAFVLGDYDLSSCIIVRYEEDSMTPTCMKYSGDICIANEHRRVYFDLTFTKAGYLLDSGFDAAIGHTSFGNIRLLNANMESRKKILNGGKSLFTETIAPSVKTKAFPLEKRLAWQRYLDLQHFCGKYPSIFEVGPRCW
jgi:hypothetical protein